MINDNLCAVDETGIFCNEHKQYLKDCAHLLQKCRLLQRGIIKYLKPKQGDNSVFAKANAVLVEARERMQDLNSALGMKRLENMLMQADIKRLNEALGKFQADQAAMSAANAHLQDYIKTVEQQANTMRALLKQVL